MKKKTKTFFPNQWRWDQKLFSYLVKKIEPQKVGLITLGVTLYVNTFIAIDNLSTFAWKIGPTIP